MDHVHPGHKSCSFLCACLWVGYGSTASTFFYVDASLPQASEPAADPTRNCELGFAVHIFFAVRSASREGHFFARPPRAFFGCSNILLVLRRRLRFFCPPLRKEMRCVCATEIASWGLRRSFFSQFALLVECDMFSPGRRGLALGVHTFCSCCAAGFGFFALPFGRRCGASTLLKLRAGVCGALFFGSLQC